MRRRHAFLAALALAACGAAAQADAPAPGRYAGRFCVTVGDAPADCGPAQVDVRSRQRLTVRIADLAYQLRLASSQVDVVLMHGTMQIDGFFASYDWDGATLRFLDLDKRTRYALEIAPHASRH
jgi:hypothetical protein